MTTTIDPRAASVLAVLTAINSKLAAVHTHLTLALVGDYHPKVEVAEEQLDDLRTEIALVIESLNQGPRS